MTNEEAAEKAKSAGLNWVRFDSDQDVPYRVGVFTKDGAVTRGVGGAWEEAFLAAGLARGVNDCTSTNRSGQRCIFPDGHAGPHLYV